MSLLLLRLLLFCYHTSFTAVPVAVIHVVVAIASGIVDIVVVGNENGVYAAHWLLLFNLTKHIS